MLRNGIRKCGVVLLPELVGLGEGDVEHDRERLLRRESLDELRVHDTRPRPASGFLLHPGEALLVYVDEDDVGIGGELHRLRAYEAVEQPVLERAKCMQNEKLERGECQHSHCDGRQGTSQRPRRFQISADSRAE